MKIIGTKHLQIILLLAGSFFSLNIEAELNSYTKAVLLSEVKVIHPDLNYGVKGPEASYDSGIVELSFMIDKQGKPFEIIVTNSSMSKFNATAIEALTQYQYKPATLNQAPVESQASVTIVFELSRRLIAFDRWYLRNEGLKEDKEFSYIVKKFNKEVKSVDPDKVKLENILSDLSGLKSRSFARLAWLSSEKLKAAEMFNDTDGRITSIQNLIIFDGLANDLRQILDEDSLSSAQIGLLKLKIESGRYADALLQYDSLYETNNKLKIIFAKSIRQIRELKKSDQLVVRDLMISDNGFITFPLFKRLFLFDQIEGAIDALKLRCETHYAKFEYKVDAEYQIPDLWGQCQLQIIGEQGTKMRIFQQ